MKQVMKRIQIMQAGKNSFTLKSDDHMVLSCLTRIKRKAFGHPDKLGKQII